MCVSPWMPGISSATSSTKHQDHSSPGPSVSAGMTVGRVITAPDLPALHADPEVQPLASDSQAVLAAFHRLGQLGDPNVIEVSAECHRFIPA